MRNDGRFIFGIVLLFFGFGFLIDQFGLLDQYGLTFDTILNFVWPLIFVVIGLYLLARNRVGGGLFFLGFGIVLFASNAFKWDFWGIFWPAILIWIGLSMLFRHQDSRGGAKSTTLSGERINETAIFWGSDKKISSTHFSGGDIDVVFGGFKLDLRNAQLEPTGAIINLNCFFGGIEIRIPKGVRVIADGTAVFGGWNNTYDEAQGENLPVLEIRGSVYFGGVDIKN